MSQGSSHKNLYSRRRSPYDIIINFPCAPMSPRTNPYRVLEESGALDHLTGIDLSQFNDLQNIYEQKYSDVMG